MNRGPADSPDLEGRIRAALLERANAYEPSETREQPALSSVRSARPWRPLLVGAGIVIAIAAAVVWFATRTASDPQPLGPTEIPAPVGSGDEIRLREVGTPDYIEAGLHLRPVRLVPGTTPFSLEAGGGEPVTISRQFRRGTGQQETCINMPRLTAPPSHSGSTGTCGAGVMQLFYYPNVGSEADPTVYYAWADVPPEAAYVTFESDVLRGWQHPIRNAVVIPVQGGPTKGTLRAYSADGASLAEVPVVESLNGSGNIPPTMWTSPAGQGKKAECDAHPGAGQTISVHDHGTGEAVTVPFLDLCYEQADLVPDDLALQRAGVSASYTFENGHVKVTYREAVVTIENGAETHTTGRELSQEEVWLRLAEAQGSR